MKLIFKVILLAITIQMVLSDSINAQNHDWRNAKFGNPIYTHGYCDQPYVVVLENGKWLCVFTTNSGHEGSRGQHIVACVSEDQGQIWSDTVRIEEPHKESASWGMPYLTDFGRVYVFYTYNGDKVHELGDQKNIREDMLGWYCYKYTDDEGKTWSDRYRIDVPNRTVDLNNDWNGEVQIFWGIGKPIDYEEGMMFSFTKIGQYMLEYSEGWLMKCENINKERDPGKLEWKLLPETDTGIKNPNLGIINSGQNIFRLNDGTLYCMHRTVSGYPAESYSGDGGKTWTLPQPPVYDNGIKLKNPRACPRIWKCKNGRYLFWYHNNGGWNFGLSLILANLAAGQLILSSKDENGKSVELKTGDFGSIEISMSDGEHSDSWTSDPGLVKATGVEHCISVIVDHGPRIIQFVINGTVNNGREARQFGWGRYSVEMKNFNFETIETHQMAGESVNITSKITHLRLYNKPLMNTEVIGNHRNYPENR